MLLGLIFFIGTFILFIAAGLVCLTLFVGKL